MARALLVGTGVVATVAGALLLAGGGAVAATFGTDGRVSTEPAAVVGTGAAILVEGLTVDAVGLPVPDDVGVLSITATAPDGSRVFLGTARDDDLDTYLTGAPYDVVASLTPGATATTRPVPGTLRPQPPTDADLWVTKAVGAPARLPARVPDGTTLVVMRPDGDDGVAASLLVTLEVDRAWPAALVGLGAGLVLLVLGLVLLRFGLRRRPVGAHAAAPGVASGGVVPAPVTDPVTDIPVEPIEPGVPAEVQGTAGSTPDQPAAPAEASGPEAEPEPADRPTTEIAAVVDGVTAASVAPEPQDGEALVPMVDAAPTDEAGSAGPGA